MDYSSIPDYSQGAANPSDVFNSPTSIGSYDWGSDTPFNNTYTPFIQQQAPAQTNWMDIFRGIGAALDAGGNAIRAYRGEPQTRGGPYDQFMAEEARKTQEAEDRNMIASLLDRYTKTTEEQREVDPNNLLQSERILDPTRSMQGIGSSRGTPSLALPRLAGTIFNLS